MGSYGKVVSGSGSYGKVVSGSGSFIKAVSGSGSYIKAVLGSGGKKVRKERWVQVGKGNSFLGLRRVLGIGSRRCNLVSVLLGRSWDHGIDLGD